MIPTWASTATRSAARQARVRSERTECKDMWFIIASYLGPIALLCGPIWFFGRKRVHWTWLDFSMTWLPFVIWFGLTGTNWMSKSLSNFVSEPLYVGILIPLCPALRLINKNWITEKKMRWATTILGAVLAAGVYLIVPSLPE